MSKKCLVFVLAFFGMLCISFVCGQGLQDNNISTLAGMNSSENLQNYNPMQMRSNNPYLSLNGTKFEENLIESFNNTSTSSEVSPFISEQFSPNVVNQSTIPNSQGQLPSIDGFQAITNETVGLLVPGTWNYHGGYIIGDVSILGPWTSGGATRIYARGGDNALWVYTYPSGPWTRLGGAITSNPTARYDENGKTHVMVRGGDGTLWDNIDGVWYPLGGYINAETPNIGFEWNPSDVNSIMIFVRGGDNGLWLRRMNINDRSGSWQSLGGVITSGPVVLQDPNVANTMRIVVRGSDNALWMRSLNTADNSGSWRSLGGWLRSEPVAIFETYGYLYPVYSGSSVYYLYSKMITAAIGGDNALWVNIYDIGTGNANWWGLGGSITTKPAIAPRYLEHWGFSYDPYGNPLGFSLEEPRDICARGTDNALWDIEITGTRSTESGASAFGVSHTWTSLGGYVTSNPIFRTSKWISVRGGDGALWTYDKIST
jgi:hypothetical protein